MLVMPEVRWVTGSVNLLSQLTHGIKHQNSLWSFTVDFKQTTFIKYLLILHEEQYYSTFSPLISLAKLSCVESEIP